MIPGDAYRGVPVVVLGASGFVGRWTARALGRLGADVYLVVRHLEPARAVFVRYGVDHAERDEATAYAINAELVDQVCAALGSCARPAWPGVDLVHVGSALEYGDASGTLSEDTPPRPTTVYGLSKLAGTRAVGSASVKHGVVGVTVRSFTVYGPGEHDGRLLPSLLEAARTGTPVPLSVGRQQRDFVYVEDVVDGLLRLGLANVKPGEVVNMATGHLTTVRAFAELAAEILHMQPDQLVFGALASRVEEMQHAEVNVDRLRQLLGWTPQQSIEAGIRRTVAFGASGRSRTS